MTKPFSVLFKTAFTILVACSAIPAFAQRGGGGQLGGGGFHGGGGGAFHGGGGGGFQGGGGMRSSGGGGPRGGSYSPPSAGSSGMTRGTGLAKRIYVAADQKVPEDAVDQPGGGVAALGDLADIVVEPRTMLCSIPKFGLVARE